MDSFGIMDVNRSGYICLLRHQTQQTGTYAETSLGTDHIGYDRYYPIRALRDHGALAPANRGMGREQNLIDYLIRIRFYASSFLSLQTREAVYEPYPLAIQHDYVSMAHATSPDGQYQ